MDNQQNHPTPDSIMQIGTGFWASKVLLSAVKFQIFTTLAERKSMSAAEIKSHLGFKCTDRNVFDYLDTLTTLWISKSGRYFRNGKIFKQHQYRLFLRQEETIIYRWNTRNVE